ncbi:hypothetical protein [Leptolyngbya sp. FACHB-261]|uniref:hypothetical protein n=1 Tax=Leptolyngbya sp. FACHB-261 TaxID=2692806 RepID=UPI0016875C14|nr:hypothetical protein [Leptolyngbya sp. FACHB-261]MBD2100103.1 hypothetical protein [Leptolyngbya sp. FACHB-261]
MRVLPLFLISLVASLSLLVGLEAKAQSSSRILLRETGSFGESRSNLADGHTFQIGANVPIQIDFAVDWLSRGVLPFFALLDSEGNVLALIGTGGRLRGGESRSPLIQGLEVKGSPAGASARFSMSRAGLYRVVILAPDPNLRGRYDLSVSTETPAQNSVVGQLDRGESQVQVLNRASRCTDGDVRKSINQLEENPSVIDAIIACGSEAIPVLREILIPRSVRGSGVETMYLSGFTRILVITALGEIGLNTTSRERELIVRDLVHVSGRDVTTLEFNTCMHVLNQFRRIDSSTVSTIVSMLESEADDVAAFRVLDRMSLGSLALPWLITTVLDTSKSGYERRLWLRELKEIDPDRFNRLLQENSSVREVVAEAEQDLLQPPFLPAPFRDASIERTYSSTPHFCRYSALRTLLPWKCR